MENVDWSFLVTQEDTKTKGYTLEPSDERFAKSGVTIATGFDIGQHNEYELDRLFGARPEVYNLLLPYVGLKGAAAEAKLKEKPLDLGKINASYIDERVKSYKYNQLAESWNKANTEIPFSDLPKHYATVLMSVAYQYGPTRLSEKTKKFWGHATSGNWLSVEAELRDFKDPFPERRVREADYLAKGNEAYFKDYPHLDPRPKPRPVMQGADVTPPTPKPYTQDILRFSIPAFQKKEAM
jgi:hypothetical protein